MKKEKFVLIESRAGWRLWSDATKEEIEQVEGTIWVTQNEAGYIYFETNPRYDFDEVLDAVREVARRTLCHKKQTSNATYDGEVPVRRPPRRIRSQKVRNMIAGEVGFTLPWAYTPRTGILNEDFEVFSKQCGTVELRVECIVPGAYRVRLIPGSTYKYPSPCV